jgi:hypothetical protein
MRSIIHLLSQIIRLWSQQKGKTSEKERKQRRKFDKKLTCYPGVAGYENPAGFCSSDESNMGATHLDSTQSAACVPYRSVIGVPTGFIAVCPERIPPGTGI